MPDLLQTYGLTKAFGAKTVLRGIDLAIGPGQCIAFIGHNGSGKSTLLKLLAGLLSVTAGRIERRPGLRFGYVPERFPQMVLTAAQYIAHMGRIEGLSEQAVREAASGLFSDFFLDGLTDIPMKNLSKGTLQKVGVVQALLAAHDVLLLDEPLSGQDVASQRVFVRKASERLEAGETILLSCHEPYLVNRLADTVYEIRAGTLHAVSRDDARLLEMDELILVADEGMQTPADLPARCVLQADGARFIIQAPTDLSQALLLRLLGEGYILRGYHHAGDR